MDDANLKLLVHKRGRDMGPRLIKRGVFFQPNLMVWAPFINMD